VVDQSTSSEDRIALLSEALHDAVAVFRRLDDEGRKTLLKTVSTLFGIAVSPEVVPSGPRTVEFGQPSERFSREQGLSPKEFLLKKQPRSDVERVACLGYYLAFYRDQPHFKTFDISKLNTEAAQSKFSNAANAVNNATTYGYLAPAVKGAKQLSAVGEKFVEALPDREAASEALLQGRPKKRQSKKATRKKAER
jgi:hypothetical protein